MDRNKRNGHIAILASSIFFGLNIPALKSLMPHWLDASQATFFRIVISAILFWIISLFVKNKPISRRDLITLVLSGIFGLAGFLYFFNLAVDKSTPVDISIIMTTPPIVVMLLSAVIFKTKITLRKSIGIAVSITGALIIILNQHEGTTNSSMMGNILGVISGVFYAGYLLAIKRASEKYNPINVLRWLFLGGSLVTIPLDLHSALQAPIVIHGDTSSILTLAFVIIFPTFLAYLFTPYAIKRIGAESVSLYEYIIPVVGSAAAIALGQDHLRWDQPIAAAIIFAGVYLASKK